MTFYEGDMKKNNQAPYWRRPEFLKGYSAEEFVELWDRFNKKLDKYTDCNAEEFPEGVGPPTTEFPAMRHASFRNSISKDVLYDKAGKLLYHKIRTFYP